MPTGINNTRRDKHVNSYEGRNRLLKIVPKGGGILRKELLFIRFDKELPC